MKLSISSSVQRRLHFPSFSNETQNRISNGEVPNSIHISSNFSKISSKSSQTYLSLMKDWELVQFLAKRFEFLGNDIHHGQFLDDEEVLLVVLVAVSIPPRLLCAGCVRSNILYVQ